jgi:hypothetical protein
MDEDISLRDDVAAEAGQWPILAIDQRDVGLRHGLASDPNVNANLDALSADANDRFDERCVASGAETAPQIATLACLAHCRSLRRANEDDIADHCWPIKQDDTPETERFARCEIDPVTTDPSDDKRRKDNNPDTHNNGHRL